MRILGIDLAITAPHRAILTDEREQFISKVLQFRTHQADLERIYADFKVQLLDRTQNIYSAFYGEPKAKGHPSLRSGQDAEPSASRPRAIGAGASPAPTARGALSQLCQSRPTGKHNFSPSSTPLLLAGRPFASPIYDLFPASRPVLGVDNPPISVDNPNAPVDNSTSPCPSP